MIVARPPDAPTLAAILVHEFQHNVLSVLLRLVRLSDADPQALYVNDGCAAGTRARARPVQERSGVLTIQESVLRIQRITRYPYLIE
ncbi:MAG TPA: HEXXH motif-containing putative peptide modification protein [Pseudonocardiaceae bacterium]